MSLRQKTKKRVPKQLKIQKAKNICLTPGEYIPDYDNLKKTVELYRKAGLRIVLTQGVYDLLHIGHALYLAKARQLGDLLVVGIDSDALTKARKGPRRPIVPEGERIDMLLHLRHVDIVTIRDVEHDIGHLIRLVQPDVLVVSESTTDFTQEQKLSYQKNCGKIVIMPPQATQGSTQRIRTLAVDGAEELASEISKLAYDFIEKIKNG
ncbi:MAG: adenylyltransferase/cytidyltransferase family protein [Candidatus Vogelbacteria bacterium]|nr:adenylyltransferase/cytidyltransferase family protein [Candidatus Vogelbacteria bacterium]